MRILLTHHTPLRQSPTGWLVWQWALGLAAAGNEVRLLVADTEHQFGEPLDVERVVCGDDPNADLKFKLPGFSSEDRSGGRPTFAELSDSELSRYRDCLRRRLDAEILRFDPSVIHCQHLWIFGQLALESGVPYVLNAWEDELLDYPQDARYQPLAEQAAENASRILVANIPLGQRVEAMFESAADRTLLMPQSWLLDGPASEESSRLSVGAELHSLYRAVLAERFG
jgi:hypothetical protein